MSLIDKKISELSIYNSTKISDEKQQCFYGIIIKSKLETMSPRSPPDCHKRSLLGMSVNMPGLWWQGQPIPCVRPAVQGSLCTCFFPMGFANSWLHT